MVDSYYDGERRKKDPFGRDVPLYEEVLKEVQLQERKEADRKIREPDFSSQQGLNQTPTTE